MTKTTLGAAIVLTTIAMSSLAWAQKPKPADKKGATPSSTPSSGTTDAASSSTTPSSPQADSNAAPAAPAAAEGAGTVTNKGTALNPGEGVDKEDSSDVTEAPGRSYYFVGLRYRGNVVPKFMLNLFVDEGKTIYSNQIGIELDMRKDDFSLIPALSYVEFGTGDILFKEKNKPDTIPGNYSIINSGLKGIFATADLLWSAKLDGKGMFAFEYGAGFGLGIIFGDLITNWVLVDPNGPVASETGRRYRYCQTEGEGGPGSGCNKADHQNASIAKVGNYTEPSWVNGGSKPNIFPWIAVPQLGLRMKPIKQLEARLGIGFSLTGFWFGLSGDYGLERPEKKTASGVPELHSGSQLPGMTF